MVADYLDLTWAFLTSEPCQHHLDWAVASESAVPPPLAVVRTLMHRCLPHLTSALASGTGAGRSDGGGSISAPEAVLGELAQAGAVLLCPALEQGLAAIVAQPDGGVAVQRAAAALAALPAAAPPGVAPGLVRDARTAVAGLLAALCIQRAVIEGYGSGGGSSDGSYGGSDGSASAGDECSPRRSGTGGAAWDAAAWEVTRAVPAMAAALLALQLPAEAKHGEELCVLFAAALDLPTLVNSGVWGSEEAAAAVAAADAGLRLLPRLADIDAATAAAAAAGGPAASHLPRSQPPRLPPRQVGEEEEEAQARPPAGMQLAEALFLQVWDSTLLDLGDWADADWGDDSSPADGPSWTGRPARAQVVPASLARQLWFLHSRACRLVHWLLAEPGRAALVPRLLPDGGWEDLVESLHSLMGLAKRALRADGGGGGGGDGGGDGMPPAPGRSAGAARVAGPQGGRAGAAGCAGRGLVWGRMLQRARMFRRGTLSLSLGWSSAHPPPPPLCHCSMPLLLDALCAAHATALLAVWQAGVLQAAGTPRRGAAARRRAARGASPGLRSLVSSLMLSVLDCWQLADAPFLAGLCAALDATYPPGVSGAGGLDCAPPAASSAPLLLGDCNPPCPLACCVTSPSGSCPACVCQPSAWHGAVTLLPPARLLSAACFPACLLQSGLRDSDARYKSGAYSALAHTASKQPQVAIAVAASGMLASMARDARLLPRGGPVASGGPEYMNVRSCCLLTRTTL